MLTGIDSLHVTATLVLDLLETYTLEALVLCHLSVKTGSTHFRGLDVVDAAA